MGEATGGQVCIRRIHPQDGIGRWMGSAVRTREDSAVELVVEHVFLRVSWALGNMHSTGAENEEQDTVCSPTTQWAEGLKRQARKEAAPGRHQKSFGGDKRGTVEHQGGASITGHQARAFGTCRPSQRLGVAS